MDINIQSEIGKLEGVILHRPGFEIEKMTPTNIQEALYSDILSRDIAQKEYALFEGVLKKAAHVFYVDDLLEEILSDEDRKHSIVEKVCNMYGVPQLQQELTSMTARELARTLVEGYEQKADFSDKRFPLPPLYNLFFTRDASVSVYNEVLINRMRHKVRGGEPYLMDQIFRHAFRANTFQPDAENFHIEGGDVEIAREDVLLIGNGCRTSKEAIEGMVRRFQAKNRKQNIVVQELPEHPDSFIHLDMVFTFLDKDACMCYSPLITRSSEYRTIIIGIDGSKVSYTEYPHMMAALKALKFDLQPIGCGNPDDLWNQQREQWHSGANFFAMAPGKIIGYERNIHTIEQLAKQGFDIVAAEDIVNGNDQLERHQRCVVTLPGSELPRGGGGARCMTMPVRREKVNW